ncbi:MAG: YraN family protein [Armatimonadota bacterium]|nr:YraN family protein [Armatimonadota bacterium]MDR5697960.1 YraN family protein [Armatimonadota bacterium]
MNRRRIGTDAEEAAVAALRRAGYRVVARNVRFRFGEIDVVCDQGGTLVFVEVKARRTADRGNPFEAVTLHKQRRIARLAEAYLQRHRARHPVCRFDVVAVELGPTGEPVAVEILPDAFRL